MDNTANSMEWVNYLLFGALMLSILLSWYNNRRSVLALAILNRWYRWILFSSAGAWFVYDAGWTGKPFWSLLVVFFLMWFLLETAYQWVIIRALSRSPIPLFPHFDENEAGEEWPAQKRFFPIRRWLKDNGFKAVQSLKAELMEGFSLRSLVYQSEDDRQRIQILFIPQRDGGTTVCFTILSATVEGTRYITDNLFLPFGGFYPENWYIERIPLTRRIARLYKKHMKRLDKTKEVFVPWEDEPLADINNQQRMLERVNTELGFLSPIEFREEFGKISQQGRYRVWKEVWLLNYLGKPISYS